MQIYRKKKSLELGVDRPMMEALQRVLCTGGGGGGGYR